MAFDLVIEKLGAPHEAGTFDCGIESMTTWVKRYGLTSKQSEFTQTYALHQRENGSLDITPFRQGM